MFCLESLAKDGLAVNLGSEQALQNERCALEIAIEAFGVSAMVLEAEPMAGASCTAASPILVEGGAPTIFSAQKNLCPCEFLRIWIIMSRPGCPKRSC